jgi:amino acid adenylation domain-containing protein
MPKARFDDGARGKRRDPGGAAMSDLAVRFEQLPVEKRRALELMLEQRQARQAASRPPAIPRRADRGPAPLSFAQERLWFLQQLDPGSCAYNTREALHISGPLSLPALRRALGACITRHDILRTVIREHAGRPVQIVLPPAPIELPLIDLEQVDAARRDALAERAAIGQADRPFTLAAAPPLRLALHRLAPDEHLLCLVTHHVVDDGWSSAVFLRELAAAYCACREERAPSWTPLPLQYADFAVWDRERMSGSRLEPHLAYWRDALAGAPPLELPFDRSRPAVPTSRGARLSLSIDARLTAAIARVGQQEGATPFMAFLTTFLILLHRCSGQTDLLVGAPVANRGHQELEALIGFFANTLVLRTDLAGDPTFREALRRVRETCVAAYAHQELPFERLVEELQPKREANRHPLVQAVFVFQNASASTGRAAELTLRRRELASTTTPFDLVLSLTSGDDGTTGFFRYSPDVFERDTMEQLAAHFVRLLDAAAADADRRISALPLLTAEEVLDAIRGGAAPVEHSVRPLAEWFDAAAHATPTAVAVRCEGTALTYGELLVSANKLAHHLRGLGVEAETRVVLCLERSIEMIVAILGVLKAGGAYVPIDPETPRTRIRFILEDAAAPVLVTQQSLLDRLPEMLGRIVCLDADRDIIAAESAAAPAAAAPADALAYVIYTSGSTGTPKGVGVTSANVSRLLSAAEARFTFSGRDVWTLAHSYAFDFSVWEMWGALAYGGTLVIAPSWITRAPEAFGDLLRDEGVTVLNQTPSAFLQLQRAELRRPSLPPALRYIVFGGEALDFAAIAPWLERAGAAGPRLINMYGITETTVHVTWHEVTRDEARASRAGAHQPSLIGEPLDDLRLHVLDRHHQPAPPGVRGELFVGGAGLARGYLGRPGLTASRFVPDPWSGGTGARLYRSGDLAIRRRDGSLEFVGRNDGQVKVRGFRIELAEIERTLERCHAIARAIVLQEPGPDGQPALTAFFSQGDEDDPLTIPAIRGWLRQRMPDYMVPAAFVRVTSWPLTINGKLDRAALVALNRAEADASPTDAAPATPVEIAVAGIWTEMLQRPRVMLDDNFFEVGGHSLLAAQLVSRVREQLGVEMPLRDFFAYPTLRSLAERVEQIGRAS